jgi:hypothetical protein
MSEDQTPRGRAGHEFHFTAKQIAENAKAEADYHQDRYDHWKERRDAALPKVRETITAKLVETARSGGGFDYAVATNHGDPEAWTELTTSQRKMDTHLSEVTKFRGEQRLYETQGDTGFNLTGADVAYFRLGNHDREE